MKKWFYVLIFLPLAVWAQTPSTPLGYLQAMQAAHKSADFELLYFLKQGEQTASLRYRHATEGKTQYAQLLHLENGREEIILKDNLVSYFGHGFQPFSLESEAILDNLPSAFYGDFSHLQGYNLVDGGRARVADRIVRIIRLVPRDDFRYKYHLWIDEENFLLLKSELLDRDNQVLEEFRVVQAYVDEQMKFIIEPINSLVLPSLLTPSSQAAQTQWQPKWLPAGFQRVKSSLQNLTIGSQLEQVEGQFYSDGLFTFSIYVVQNKGIVFDEQFWRNDKLSIYSHTIGDKDVVIMGEIPLITAKYIVEQIQFEEEAK
ncbi:negative regulator of sigmaE [Pasteurellaceae bacterium RH1A]|nr:negative regulator of sigmaE [Pasteurellaceae bacterium RH1A]